MQVLQISFMKALIYLLAPSSPAFGNAKNSFFTKQQQNNTQIDTKLQPADIVFTKTHTLIYNSSRSFLGIQYDHVAVVINQDQLLHISPPIVSRLPIGSLVNKNRSPMIIRPKLDQKQKQQFLKQCLNLLGTKYSMSSIPQMFLHQMMSRLNLPQKNQFHLQSLKQSRICSDAILYALCTSSQAFRKELQDSISFSSYSKLGFFMPDDVLTSLKKLYPVVYQQNQKPQSKPILQIASQKLQKLYEGVKSNTGSFLILAKIMTMINKKTSLKLQASILKNILLKNLKIVSLAMLFCDMIGLQPGSLQYNNKIVLITSLLTLIGSSLWVRNQPNMQTQAKYELPDPSKVQNLTNLTNFTKPKL